MYVLVFLQHVCSCNNHMLPYGYMYMLYLPPALFFHPPILLSFYMYLFISGSYTYTLSSPLLSSPLLSSCSILLLPSLFLLHTHTHTHTHSLSLSLSFTIATKHDSWIAIDLSTGNKLYTFSSSNGVEETCPLDDNEKSSNILHIPQTGTCIHVGHVHVHVGHVHVVLVM